jgi:hypothetical protein
MAELHQDPSPVMGGAARFEANEAWAQLAKEGYQIPAPERLLHDDLARLVDAMNLEDALRKVDPNGGNLLHGRRSSDDVFDDNHHGTLMPP